MLDPRTAISGRPRREVALAFVGAWLAFVAGLELQGELADLGATVLGVVTGGVMVALGIAAASRCRALPRRAVLERGRLAGLSAAVGIGLGVANLLANALLARAHPAIGRLLGERMATLDPTIGIVAAPMVEEIALRLFLLSSLAWILWKITHDVRRAFLIALWASAFLFAAAHLIRPMPEDLMLAAGYSAALLAKYTLLGLPLGSIFWRWGLPYAILVHAAANAAHFAVERLFYSNMST